jgi:hypothetical protein
MPSSAFFSLKNFRSNYSVEKKKKLLIIKFDYYRLFVCSVEDAYEQD